MIDGATIFSTTQYLARGELGDRVTRWRGDNHHLHIHSVDVRQSSDRERHCLTVVVWWCYPEGASR